MKKLALSLVLVACHLTLLGDIGEHRSEGSFRYYKAENAFELIALFLPFNPTTAGFGPKLEIEAKCSKWWPKGILFLNDENEQISSSGCDLFWVESDGAELCILEQSTDLLMKAKVVYTSIHFFHRDAYYAKLRQHLDFLGFSMIAHWYKEGLSGNAVFVKKELLSAAINSSNYLPPISSLPMQPPAPFELERFLKKAKNKSSIHCMDEIDFIYMINLDERPEKFDLASSGLKPYDIYPYRFSAVNGWKISTDVFDQIGVKFSPDSIHGEFMGTYFAEVDGKQYVSNEMIQAKGASYFTWKMFRGSVGIVLSHLSVLQDAFDSGYQTIWIMEDDIEPLEDPRQVSELIRKLDLSVEDWDILFTDIDTKDAAGNHVPCRSIAARPNFNVEPLSSFLARFYEVNSEFSRTGMRYGAYSMIVRRSGMEKILSFYRTYRIFLPYDMDIWLIPDLKMYNTNKDIVSHRVNSLTDNGYPGYLKKQ